MRRLLLSVHDVTPANEPLLRRLVEEIERTGIARYSMLVIPEHKGSWPLEEHPEFCRWLSGLAAGGVEMLLHGMTHEGDGGGCTLPERFRAFLFTRGEGEFLGRGKEESLELLTRGRLRLREAIGCDIPGFVAPAWLYGRGSVEALKEAGFPLAESRWRVWSPSLGTTLTRAPVSNFAGGGLPRRWLAALWVRVYSVVMRGSPVVRFALHPEDAASSLRLARAMSAVEGLYSGRTASTLGDLLPAP